MARMQRRFAILACVISAAALAFAISAASGAKLKTKSASTIVSTEAWGSQVTAQCDQGTKAISGGFHGEVGTEPGDPAVATNSSWALGPRKWTVEGENLRDDPG
jgi:hypothetical protein